MKKIKLLVAGLSLATIGMLGFSTTKAYAYTDFGEAEETRLDDDDYNRGYSMYIKTETFDVPWDKAFDKNGDGFISDNEIPYHVSNYYHEVNPHFDLDTNGGWIYYRVCTFARSSAFKLAQELLDAYYANDALNTFSTNSAIVYRAIYQDMRNRQAIADEIASLKGGKTYTSYNFVNLGYEYVTINGVEYVIIDANHDGIINTYQYDTDVTKYTYDHIGGYTHIYGYDIPYLYDEYYDEIFYADKLDVNDENSFEKVRVHDGSSKSITTVEDEFLKRFWQYGERARHIKSHWDDDVFGYVYDGETSIEEFEHQLKYSSFYNVETDNIIKNYECFTYNPFKYAPSKYQAYGKSSQYPEVHDASDVYYVYTKDENTAWNDCAYNFEWGGEVAQGETLIKKWRTNSYKAYLEAYESQKNWEYFKKIYSDVLRIEGAKEEKNQQTLSEKYKYEIDTFSKTYDLNTALYISYREKGYSSQKALELSGTYNVSKSLEYGEELLEENKPQFEETLTQMTDQSFLESLQSIADNFGNWLMSLFS